MIIPSQMEEASQISRVPYDRNYFSKIYDQYFQGINNYVHYRVADFYAADDIVNLVFEKAYFKLSYYQASKATFSVWLYSIARNSVIDYYRKRSRNHDISMQIIPEFMDDSDPSEEMEAKEIKQMLINSLTCLNKRECDIITMKFWWGLSNRNIAAILNISESNTGVIIYRAIRKLRERINLQG